MKPQATSEELQAHIRQARHDLDTHSQEMFKQARAEFNWRNIVAKHPLLALGTAATAGFLLAPVAAAAATRMPGPPRRRWRARRLRRRRRV